MIIAQEENGPVEEFYLRKNVFRVFETINTLSQATKCDTEELKSFLEETQVLLRDFVKHIEKVEKKQQTDSAKIKFQNITHQDFGE